MKQGRFQELKELLTQNNELSKAEDTFVTFMDQMIEQSGLSRSTIVQRAGLSKDYMYKVLRGDKRTTERDYIIAFCMAMDLSLPETQHALELYPFQTLDSDDLRSHLIIAAILGKTGIDDLNETLKSLGFPMLRTSPDMPSAKVGPVRSTYGSLNSINFVSDEGDAPKMSRRFKDMKKINTTVKAERAGCAPIDIAVGGEFELADDNGKTVFAQAYFGPEISFYAVDEVSLYDEQYMDKTAQLEYYESLEEAGDSEYLMYFVELDKLTDVEYLQRIWHQINTYY